MTIDFKHPSFTEITIMFWEYEKLEDGTREKAELLNRIAEKLYYIPTVLVQPYKWSDSAGDIHSAGLEALAKAILRYNIKLNNNFFLYSYKSVKGSIHKEQKKEIEWKEIAHSTVSLEEHEDSLFSEYDAEDDLITQEMTALVKCKIKKMDEVSQFILNASLGFSEEVLSLRQIAKKLNMCHETVRRIRAEEIEGLQRYLHRIN